MGDFLVFLRGDFSVADFAMPGECVFRHWRINPGFPKRGRGLTSFMPMRVGAWPHEESWIVKGAEAFARDQSS